MHRIFILGPQGSGKGTQAQLLSLELGIPHLSMGHLLREAAEGKDEVARIIRGLVDTGSSDSNDVAKMVLLKRLSAPDTRDGYILDGFPRNKEQFAAFADMDQPTAVVVITIRKETSLERLLKRARTEGRTDDTLEVIEKRLHIYEQDTVPLLEEYKKRGIVKEVDGQASIQEVAKSIKELFIS